MAFNLPPFWSAGYALPSNVRIEDLQRGAFTTRQQPQGSYDNPPVGDGGYAVPNYVLAQPYGQGAHVTKMMPRGETVIGVPHYLQVPRAQILSQTKASGGGTNYEIGPVQQSVHAGNGDPFHGYGVQVANTVLGHLKRLPKAQQKPALRALFHKIDPNLYTRVQATASKAARAGVPAPRALHHAIATEFRAGFLRELHAVGTSGQVKTPLMGLGCWGCAAIGLGGLGGLGDNTTAPTTPGLRGIQAVPTVPAVGSWQRAPASGVPDGAITSCGYVWVGTGVPTTGTSAACPPVRKGGWTGPTGPQALPPCGSLDKSGRAIAPCDPNATPPIAGTVTVGPFTFATGNGTGGRLVDQRNHFTSPSQMTADQHKWVADRVKGHTEHQAGGNDGYNIYVYWFPELVGTSVSSADTIDSDYKSPDGKILAVNPIEGNITNPIDPSQKYGVFLAICGDGPNCGPSGPFLTLQFGPMSIASTTAWSQTGGAIGGFLSSVASAIGDLGCAVLKNPFSSTAAGAASGGAAAAGAQIGANICGGGSPPPGNLMAPGGGLLGSIGLGTIAAVGGGLALVYLMTHKHKHRRSSSRSR